MHQLGAQRLPSSSVRCEVRTRLVRGDCQRADRSAAEAPGALEWPGDVPRHLPRARMGGVGKSGVMFDGPDIERNRLGWCRRSLSPRRRRNRRVQDAPRKFMELRKNAARPSRLIADLSREAPRTRPVPTMRPSQAGPPIAALAASIAPVAAPPEAIPFAQSACESPLLA